VLAPLAPASRLQRPRGMNTSLTAYTHLESLLLFQSLHAHGLAPHVFSRVSELLKSNPHIAQDKRFESGRLSPDALRNFYLHILKDELRSERAPSDADSAHADAKPSRKRKAPSPTLPTVQESVQHQHLIPHLVNKLYARYRTAITDQIRHDEERYERLQRDLHGIERGDWDEQLRERAPAHSASRSPSLPTKSSPLLSQQPSPSKASPHPVPDGPPKQPLPSEPRSLVPQNGQSRAAASPSPRKRQTPTDQRAVSSTPQPQATSSKAHIPQTSPSHLHPPQSGAAAHSTPPLATRPPYPHAQPQVQTQNAPASASPHPSQPHAAGVPTALQPPPNQPVGGNGIAPHYGASPPQFSPTHQRFLGPHPVGSQSPSTQPPPQQRNYPPYPPQLPTGQPPPQGGFMLPPFQVSPQDPARAQQPLHTHYPQASTPVSTRQLSAKVTPQSANLGRHGVPPMHPLVTQARHSFSTPSGMRTPNSAISTPTSARSQWKAAGRKFAAPDPHRPEPEPVDDYLPSHTPLQDAPKAKASRKSRSKAKAKEKEKEQEPQPEPEEPVEESIPEKETRQGRSRRKATARRARPGSIASSQAGTSVRERSRSQSVLSHTETIAADNESQAGSKIKSERGGSIDVIEEDVPSLPQRTTRRRGNLQASQPSNKRKRSARELSPEETEEPLGLPGIPQSVAAPRHFSRMCTPLMNDIGSHKHASTFTTAVKAKDAEGYYEIIRRPTDLKTIQKAIAAGAKQVTAAASGDTPAGSPGGGGAVVELPATADNVPPKAIVNSSQLEKELMRMFANAVMFNAGEEGVVEDAREMFETVQRSVSSWRSVERSSGRLEVEETPPAVEEDIPAASKRRKL